MISSIRMLFDTSDFPARWHCGDWTPLHGWTHIVSDLLIALAYLLIPLALARYCWLKRNELAFPRVVWLFAAFIFSCGATHFIEAILFYHPIYRFAALLKMITAAVSLSTVVAITRVAPKALELPGVRRMNQQLQEQLVLTTQAREALKKSNRDLEAFTGVVTHDLRNPISTALFMSELAKENAAMGKSETASEHLELVIESLRRMDSLVKDLHAQSLTGWADLEQNPIPLEEVIDAVRKTLSPLLKLTHTSVSTSNLPSVMGNRTLLIQLFTNLLENSIKYRSDASPEVVFRGKSGVDCWIVEVVDNGRGIPVEDDKRIFEPQVRAANASDTCGSGMGLPLCRMIMEEHKGSIRLGKALGAGAVFELRFPFSPQTSRME